MPVVAMTMFVDDAPVQEQARHQKTQQTDKLRFHMISFTSQSVTNSKHAVVVGDDPAFRVYAGKNTG